MIKTAVILRKNLKDYRCRKQIRRYEVKKNPMKVRRGVWS